MHEENFKRNLLAFSGDALTSQIGIAIMQSYIILLVKWSYARSVNLPVEEASNWIVPLFTIGGGIFNVFFLFAGIAFTAHLERKKVLVGSSMLLSRVMIFLMAVSIFVVNAKLLPWALLLLNAIFIIIASIGGANWNELVLRAFSPPRIGLFSQYFVLISGIANVVGLYVAIRIFSGGHLYERLAQWIPVRDPLAAKYILSLGFGGLMLTLSGIFPFLVHEGEVAGEGRRTPREALREKARHMLQIIRDDKNYRCFLTFVAIFSSGLYLRQFGALYVTEELHYGEEVWGKLSLVSVIAGMFSFFFWRWIGDKKGWKIVSMGLGVSLELSFLAYLAAKWAAPPVFLSLSHFFSGSAYPASFHVFRNLVGNLGYGKSRPTYLSLVLMIEGATCLLSGIVALPLIDLIGLKMIFFSAALIIMIGLLRFARQFKEEAGGRRLG